MTSAARACPPVQGERRRHGRLHRRAGHGVVNRVGVNRVGVSLRLARPSSRRCRRPSTVLRAAAPISQTEPSVLKMLTIPAAQSVTKNTGTVLQGWSVTATGAMARAMEAEEATSSGVASVRCAEPGSDLWFVGPGQQSGAAQIQLDLMNVDTLTATVDVTAVTDAGPVRPVPTPGLPSRRTRR